MNPILSVSVGAPGAVGAAPTWTNELLASERRNLKARFEEQEILFSQANDRTDSETISKTVDTLTAPVTERAYPSFAMSGRNNRLS